MSVGVRRHGKGWSYNFVKYENGQRKQVTRSGFRTERDAARARAAAIATYHRGTHIDHNRMTVGQWLVDWLPGCNIRATTRARYESIVNKYLVPKLGGIKLQELKPATLSKWYRELERAGLAPKTVRNIHGVLHKALQDAFEQELVGRNVTNQVRRSLPSGGSPEMQVWSPEQLRTFLASVKSQRLYAAWRLVAQTGLRRGEIVGLRWDDVDLATGTVRVAEALVMVNYTVQPSRPKTKKGERVFQLDPTTLDALKVWQMEQAQERLAIGPRYVESGRVFTTAEGHAIHPQRFSDWFAQRAKAAGLPAIRLHDVRHSYATAALQAGVSPKVVSARLGHSTVQFTMDTYMHVLPAMDQEAADTIAAVIDG